jgi:DNA-binding response OmpR family regulator
VASFLNKGLRARGFEVEHVSTGLEALAQLEQHGADLVVLDLGLPDIDGLEVMRRLRDSGRRTPVIILTARVEAEDQRAALELGVADYMTKPFSFGELVERVHAVLDA